MNEAAVLFLFLVLTNAESTISNADALCRPKFITQPTPATRLTDGLHANSSTVFLLENLQRRNLTELEATNLIETVFRNNPGIVGVLLSRGGEDVIVLNFTGRIKVVNGTGKVEEDAFWRSFQSVPGGWTPAFRPCNYHPQQWLHGFVTKTPAFGFGVFFAVFMDQCNSSLIEIFRSSHRCDTETTYCAPRPEAGDRKGGYRCLCRDGFYYPGANSSWRGFAGEDIENGLIDSVRCHRCPEVCDACERSLCVARRDVYLKTAILGIQLACMGVTIILGLVVFKQRKTKSIAAGMWTILETILFGIFVLYCTVIVRFFEPSLLQCLLEPWAREMGFIICYGAVILKLYRHLIEFRTRKAHRWVVKDTDLLKYLLIMIMSVFAYMAAYTAIALNFLREDYSLLGHGVTPDGLHYDSCKPLWWDYVTETGEIIILIFGIHLSYASRNARTQFHERNFLCAAISIELAVSTLFYASRIVLLPRLHPDLVLIIYCLRTQLSTSSTLLLVFIPKFWYQQKQVRSLAQEYSCRIPVDAFKDVNAHGPLTGNNSDVDVGEVTLADMSPDDIRAELKRLYLQLELFKSKTICRDNPHISKRRGGRKAQHRRFSLQNLHGKHRPPKQPQEEVTEAEPSRTPEDSVCSNEGPSAIYSDLPSTAHALDQSNK